MDEPIKAKRPPADKAEVLLAAVWQARAEELQLVLRTIAQGLAVQARHELDEHIDGGICRNRMAVLTVVLLLAQRSIDPEKFREGWVIATSGNIPEIVDMFNAIDPCRSHAG